MSALTFASCSEVIHLWDVEADGSAVSPKPSSALPTSIQYRTPTAPTKTLSPHQQNIHAIQWNHNNTVIASGSADGTIALSSLADGKLIMRLPLASAGIQSLDRVASLVFSSGSRYLCSGSGSAVYLWDLKKPDRAPKPLTGHSAEVLALDFGNSDTTLASCSVAGEILLHNLTLSTLTAKLASDGSPLRDVQHSPHRKNLLASGGDSGTVQIWDVSIGSIHASLKPSSTSGIPAGPLNALRFSTTSQSLLASVGVDKRLCFYDINSKKCIRDIVTDYALTSVDYHSDGTSLVLGTLAGHILTYDIRAASKPTSKILNAHMGRAVHAVKFQQELDKNKAGRATAPPAQQQPQHNMTLPPTTTGLNSTTINNTTILANQTAPPLQQASSSQDLFSPVKSNQTVMSNTSREFNAFANQSRSQQSAEFKATEAEAQAMNPPSTASPFGANQSIIQQRSVNSTAIFTSPSANNNNTNLTSDPSLLLTPVHQQGGFESNNTTTTATGQQLVPFQSSHQPPSHLQSSYNIRPVMNPPAHLSASFQPLLPPSSSHAPSAQSIPALNTNTDSSSVYSPRRNPVSKAEEAAREANMQLMPSPIHRRNPLSASPHASSPSGAASSGAPIGSPSSSASSAAAGSSGGGAGAGLSDYQVSLLRSMLDESLYAMRNEFRTQLTDLHMEMLKQFHLQQIENNRNMENLINRFQVMVNEVKDLREDYKNLKHLY